MKSKQIQPKQVDPLSPQGRGLSNDIVGYGQNLLRSSPSKSFAGLGEGEQMGLDALQNNLGFMGSNPGQPLINDILSGSRLSPNTNPYLASVIGGVRSAGEDNLGMGMNVLDAMFNKAGMGNSSGRSNEAVRLAENSVSNLDDTIANMLFGQFNQGMNEQTQTLGMLPSFNAGNTSAILQSLAGLALPRQLEQSENDFNYNAMGDRLLLLSQILSGQPGFNFATPQYAPSQFTETAMGLGSLMQGGGALMGGM